MLNSGILYITLASCLQTKFRKFVTKIHLAFISTKGPHSTEISMKIATRVAKKIVFIIKINGH